MGQAFSDPHEDDDKVMRAVEALDEIVWDDSIKIDSHVLQKTLMDANVHSQKHIKQVENIMKNKQAEQTRMQRFYTRKTVGEPCVAGLAASSSHRVERYDLVLSYIWVKVVANEFKQKYLS